MRWDVVRRFCGKMKKQNFDCSDVFNKLILMLVTMVIFLGELNCTFQRVMVVRSFDSDDSNLFI